MRRQLVAITIAATIVLAACTDGSDDPGFSSLGGSPSPTASAEASAEPQPPDPATPEPSPAAAEVEVDPTVIPPVEEMDKAYVEAVVNAIEARSGELFAAILAEPVNPVGATPPGTIESLGQLYGAERLELNIEEAEALAASEAAREFVLPAGEYEGLMYDVLQVSYSEPDCLIAIARVDRSESAVEGGIDPVLSILSLTAASASDEINPTSWKILSDTPNANADDEPNSDEFAFQATLADIDPVLTHTCDSEDSRVP